MGKFTWKDNLTLLKVQELIYIGNEILIKQLIKSLVYRYELKI